MLAVWMCPPLSLLTLESDSKTTDGHGSFRAFHAAHEYAVAALDNMDVPDGFLTNPILSLEFIQ